MGKKPHGKERRDNYYQLAKLQGFRARSAFKLVHLAQKHNLFARCTSVLDLCAAPGGWLQVAQQNLPMAATIVGVDLAPIKPIRGVTTMQADITSQRCRTMLKKELQMGEVDLVLHDGAPNVGTNWVRDAYVQNELTLHATKLASEFLKPGGIFVTKVFRSQDYNSLLWVFNQLFRTVNATKPQSSRDQSAEIFVVCANYLAPSKIDPRFFDPKIAFLSAESPESLRQEASLSSLAPADRAAASEKKSSVKEILKARGKRNRGGYEDGDDYSTGTALEFLNCSNPAHFITYHNKMTFPSPECDHIVANPRTTEDIIATCDDLKVLGQRELSSLIRWRFRLLRDIAVEKRAAAAAAAGDEPIEDALPAADGEEFDEEAAEAELKQLVSEEQWVHQKAERKRRAKERKLEWRRKLVAGGFPEGDEGPDLFRATEYGRALLEEDHEEDPILRIGSDQEDDVLHVPNAVYEVRIGEEDAEQQMAQMEMDLEMDHKMKKIRERKREKLKELEQQTLTRRKKVQLERIQEMKDFETSLSNKAREMFWSRKKESDDEEDEDDEADDQKLRSVSKAGETDNHENEASDGSDGEASETSTAADEQLSSHEEEEQVDDAKADAAARAAALRNKKGGKKLAAAALKEAGLEVPEEVEDPAVTEVKRLKAERWFSNPLFANVAAAAAAVGKSSGGEGQDSAITDKRKKGKVVTVEDPRVEEFSGDEDVEMGGGGYGVHDPSMPPDPDDSEFPLLPLNAKKLKKEKRAKEQARQEAKKKRKALANGDEPEGLGVKDDAFVNAPFEEVSAETTQQAPKNFDEIAKIQAIGSLLTKKESRMDMIDNGFNRYAFNDDEETLPIWFKEEEAKHNKPELALPKELEKEFRKKLREVQERPIRKVLEAKFRKKKRATERVARLNAQANVIANTPDMNEAARLRQIKKMVSKVKREQERPKQYLVSRSAGGALSLGKNKQNKNAVVKVVDKRLKADKRGMRASLKKKKGKKVSRR